MNVAPLVEHPLQPANRPSPFRIDPKTISGARDGIDGRNRPDRFMERIYASWFLMSGNVCGNDPGRRPGVPIPRRFRWILLISLLIFILFPRQAFSQNHGFIPSEKTQEKFLVSAGDSLLQLRRPFVIRGSDSLYTRHQMLVANRDYEIDYRLGLIRIHYQPAFPETLFVHYRALPFSLKPSYRIFPFILWKESPRNKILSENRFKSPRPAISGNLLTKGELRKSGSITRSLILGNHRGLRLDSGLRLQLEGRLASDVNVVAALSDQNTPIQPEGNTQSLQEIDKVYLQLQSPNLTATLGDFTIQFQGGRYGRYQRKLQGAQIILSRKGIQASFSGAVSRGKFHTNRFLAEEGRQGPYQLRGDRGQTEIIVLAGTERVWIDGELMTRGEENDYVIDYSSGQITFTRNRLVTADSRIEVDFEYSDLHFPRNLYSARISGIGMKDHLKFAFALIREADDKNNPLEADLSEQEKRILAQVGDSLQQAFVESGVYVGQGKGGYIRIDSLQRSVFRYVGRGKGDYQVRFSYVGEQAGDYRYLGSGKYEYVGSGRGNYTARRNVPVAQSQNLASFLVDMKPTHSLSFTGEVAMSRTDLNLYSSRDDQDNIGTAFQVQAAVQPERFTWKQHNLGRLQLRALWRQQGRQYFEITRNQEVEYNRRWDLDEQAGRGESVQELTGSYSPWKGVRMGVDFGRLARGEFFRSSRGSAVLDLSRPHWPSVFYREELVQKQDGHTWVRGHWLRRLGRIHYQLWRFSPTLRYEAEKKHDRSFSDSLRTGFSFTDLTAGLSFQAAKRLQLSYEQNIRRDRRVAQQRFQDHSEARSQKFTLSLTHWRNLQLQLAYTTRVRRYHQHQQPEKRTRLADIHFRYSPLGRALQSDFRLQMSTNQIARTEQFYFKVEQGQGNYRFDPDLNEYVPDPFGEYILRTLATGEFEPVNDMLLNGKFTFKPRLLWGRKSGREKGWESFLSGIGWETYFAVNEKSRRENPWKIHLHAHGLVFPDPETVFGRYTVRQDFYLFENVPERSLRFRWMENFEKNNRLTAGGQSTLRQEQSLRYRMRINRRFSLQSNVYQRRSDRLFAMVGRVNRRILSRGGDARLSYRPKSTLEIAADITVQRDLDRIYSDPTRTRLVSVKPNFSYAFRGRGRLRGELEFARVDASPANRIIPYEMANGRRLGRNFRWQVSLDYRLSAKLMILVSYMGRKEPVRNSIQHLGKAEVKAYF